MAKFLTGSVAALSLLASAPAFAAPANPAASLSISPSVHAGAPTAGKSKLGGGGGFLAAIIAAGVVAIGVVAIVNDSNSDSN